MQQLDPGDDPIGPRRFQLGDAMALVAAAAIGVWILGGLIRTLPTDQPVGPLECLHRGWVAIPVGLSLTLLPLNLARREDRRRLRRGMPGLLVHAVVAACVARRGAILIAFWISGMATGRFSAVGDRGLLRLHFLHNLWFELPGEAGIGVACCWSALAAVGVWRAEPSWDDRLGRAVGLAWVAGLALEPLMAILIWLGSP